MEIRSQKFKPYYESLDKRHDELLRCFACQKLVTTKALFEEGCCPKCGTRKVQEVRSLSLFEWLIIKLGFLRFDHSDLFLKEFSAKGKQG